MAIKFFDCKGFGQVELNQVSFIHDGRVEAQCAFSDDFAGKFPMTATEATAGKIYGEVGAFYAVDKANGVVKVPTTALDAAGCPIAINYSTEHIYNQFTPGRRNFCQIRGEFYPRLGFVSVGEKFTTNTVAYDDTVFTGSTIDDYKGLWSDVKTKLAAGTAVYACVVNGSDGKLVLGADPDDALGGVVTKVVKAYTNADGTLSFMFQVINKPE